MFASTPAGFKDAPASKLLCIGTIILPLAASLLNVQYLYTLQVNPHLTVWHQWYRLILNSTVYTDQVRAFVAAELFYECRAVERLLGSRKFTRIVAGTWIITAIATPLALALLQPIFGPITATSGATAIVAGLVACYNDLVPPIFTYTISGVATFTDKSLLLLLAPNLIFSSGNLVKSVLGWVTGIALLNMLK